MRKFLTAATVTIVAWMLLAPAALAQGDGEKVGENIGNLLGGWAKSLFVGIAAVVALMFLSTAASPTWRCSWWRRCWSAGS